MKKLKKIYGQVIGLSIILIGTIIIIISHGVARNFILNNVELHSILMIFTSSFIIIGAIITSYYIQRK